jgi:hypothetical protein
MKQTRGKKSLATVPLSYTMHKSTEVGKIISFLLTANIEILEQHSVERRGNMPTTVQSLAKRLKGRCHKNFYNLFYIKQLFLVSIFQLTYHE